MAQKETRDQLLTLAAAAQRQLLRKTKPKVQSGSLGTFMKLDAIYRIIVGSMVRLAKEVNKPRQDEKSPEVVQISKEAMEKGNQKTKDLLAETKKEEERNERVSGFKVADELKEGFFIEVVLPCSDPKCTRKSKTLACLMHEDPYASFRNTHDYGPISCTSSEVVNYNPETKKFEFVKALNQISVQTIALNDKRPVIRDYACGKVLIKLRELGSEQLALGQVHENTVQKKKKEEEEETNEDEGEETEEPDELHNLDKIQEVLNLEITSTGCIVKEEAIGKATGQEKEQLEQFELGKKGRMVEIASTESVTRSTYLFDSDLKQLTVVQPNLSTILRNIVKIGAGNPLLVINKFVYLRHVKRTVVRSNGEKKVNEFLEPVYASINQKTVRKEEEEGETKKPAKTINIGTTGPYLQFIFVSMARGKPVIRVVTDRYMNGREVLHHIVEDYALKTSEYLRGEVQPVAEQEKTASTYPEVLSRGITAKFRYSAANVIVEQKEYRSKYGISRHTYNLTNIVEKEMLNVRYKSVKEKKEERASRQHMYTLKKLESEGVFTMKLLEREENGEKITEEIREPSMDAVAQWLLRRPEAANLTSKDNVMVTPEISFIAVTTYIRKERESVDEPFPEFKTRTSLFKHTLVRCKVTQNKNYSNYRSVKSLKDNLAKIDDKHWASLYELDRENQTILTSTVDTKAAILKAFQSDSDKLGKEIAKFPLYSQAGELITEVEMKSSLVDKSKEKSTAAGARVTQSDWFCRPEYSPGFEAPPIASAIHLQLTPAKRVLNRFLVLSPDKLVQVTETEPNVLTILTNRACQQDKSHTPAPFAPTKAELSQIVRGKAEKSTIRPTTAESHEAVCPFFKYGLFGIKSRVTVSEVSTVDEGEERREEICRVEMIKVVHSHCRKCNNANILKMNADRLSDGAVFTLPTQKISPLDVYQAMEWLEQATLACHPSHKVDVLNRMKHLLQRSMNHERKRIAEEDTAGQD